MEKITFCLKFKIDIYQINNNVKLIQVEIKSRIS